MRSSSGNDATSGVQGIWLRDANDGSGAQGADRESVPEHEIVIATGGSRGLEVIEKEYEIGIADPRCPVKYVITQHALAESWD